MLTNFIPQPKRFEKSCVNSVLSLNAILSNELPMINIYFQVHLENISQMTKIC